MARHKILGSFNIPESILTYAESVGLEAMGTGGNVDYVYKELGKNEDGSPRVVLLGDREDAGSPDSLTSKCELHIMLNEDWTSQISFPAKTAREGMKIIASMYNPMR
jgi:hypothetical protein